MSWNRAFHPAKCGTHVEVRSRFDQRWVQGFEVVEPVDEPAAAYRILRRSDHAVLPVLFAPEDVREDPTDIGF